MLLQKFQQYKKLLNAYAAIALPMMSTTSIPALLRRKESTEKSFWEMSLDRARSSLYSVTLTT